MSRPLHAFYELRALPYIMAQIGLRRPKIQVEQQVVPAGEARMLVLRPLVVHRPRHGFVFFVPPMGWPLAGPSLFRFVGHWFAERGFTVFIPGYRSPPQHTWPAPMEDLREAMRVCQELRPHQELEDSPVLVGGMGLGATLAGLLLFRDREQVGLSLGEVGGYFSIAGAMDLEHCTLPTVRRQLGDLGAAADLDPFPHITGSEGIAVLAIHGERDAMVDLRCSQALAQRTGGLLHTVPAAGHRDMARIFLQAREETRVLEHWLDDVDAG